MVVNLTHSFLQVYRSIMCAGIYKHYPASRFSGASGEPVCMDNPVLQPSLPFLILLRVHLHNIFELPVEIRQIIKARFKAHFGYGIMRIV